MNAASPAGSPLAGLPSEQGVGQLRWLIERVAAGDLPLEALIGNFRAVQATVHDAARRVKSL